MGIKAWQLGSPGTVPYRCYDSLRRRLNCKLVSYLLSRCVKEQGVCILEAGSGPAFASSILARDQRVGLSAAVDLDVEALLEARRRDPELIAIVADVHRMPFRDDCIDLTWNSSTLEHLDDPCAALEEMHRITRRGGGVFVGVPYLYGPLGFQRLVADTSVGVWIGTTFNRSELMRMMSRAGLNPMDHLFYFFRFFVGVFARK